MPEQKVRRAPHATTGEPWPMPQYYTTKKNKVIDRVLDKFSVIIVILRNGLLLLLLLLLWLLLFKMDRISLYWNVTPILVKRLFGWNFSYLLITNRLVYYFITWIH
jgi:hypothetical protein